VAAEWHTRAASKGLANAQYHMGLLYERGEGVPRDEAAAARWYRQAAQQGEAAAQANLGLMYRDGRGVPQDDALAYAWLSLAAEAAGDAAPADERAVQARADLEKRMSQTELAAGRAQMVGLLRRAATAP
jgi:TPR repeat protein